MQWQSRQGNSFSVVLRTLTFIERRQSKDFKEFKSQRIKLNFRGNTGKMSKIGDGTGGKIVS